MTEQQLAIMIKFAENECDMLEDELRDAEEHVRSLYKMQDELRDKK